MAGKTHRIGPNLIETTRAFASEENCHIYLEAARWPDGVRCLKCDHDKVCKFTLKGVMKEYADGTVRPTPNRFLYQCMNCQYQFAATTGTIFSDTHLPLSKWMMAIAIICNAKKGVSAKQMERDLGVSYKTAWYLNHRIREAMNEGMDMFGGIVEADATFVGGKYDKRRKRAKYAKQPVFGLLQRSTKDKHSRIYTERIETESKLEVTGVIEERVSADATIYTDESAAYRSLGKIGRQHAIVVHSKGEYVRGEVHNNGVENFWSLFKRGVIGSFHKVSVKHLDRYLAEFQFRFNNRQSQEIFATVILGLVIGSALRYKVLTAPQGVLSAPPSASQTDHSDEPS